MDHRIVLMGASALVLAAVATPSFAQTARTGSPVNAAAEATVIDEVLVTARKKQESLQDVPVAVTAATGEQLERTRIDEPNDLARLAPSLQISASPGGGASSVSITLRGQRAADTLLTVSQPVGVYQDGVNIPHPVGSDASFYDLERIEILAGPQGTLYGRNTTGGAMNIITRGADFDDVHGYIEGELGKYNTRRVVGAVNVPIIKDVLALRLAGQHYERDGYSKSIISGQDIGGNRDDDSIRATLDYRPMDGVTAVLKYEYSKIKRGGVPYSILYQTALVPALTLPEAVRFAGPTAAATLNGCTTTDLFLNCGELLQRDDTTTHHVVADVSWQVTDAVKVRSITGYHYFKNVRIFDLDATPFILGENGYGVGGAQFNTGLGAVPAGARLPNGALAPSGPFSLPVPLRPDQESGQFTQEFNFSGAVGRLDWLVGAFYSNDKGNGVQVTQRNPATGISTGPFFAPSANAFDGLDVDSKTYAVFTQNDFKITDQLSVTVGARYTEEKLSQNIAAWTYNPNFQSAALPALAGPGRNFQCTFGPFSGAASPDQFGGARPINYQATLDACAVTQKAKFHGTSYLGSLNYKITDDTLVYLKYSKGFRGGALQLRAPYVDPVKPETAKDLELGFKGDFFEHRLRLNLAAYRTNYTNQQQTGIEFVPGQPTVRTTVLRNASAARYQGAEVEWRVLPMEGLAIYGNAGVLDAYYRNWPNAPVALGNPAPATIDAKGTQIELPKYTGNLGARYEHDLGPGRIGFQADLNFFTKTPLTALTNEFRVPDSYEKFVRKGRQILSARIDFELPDSGWQAAVWATNLTNEHYASSNIATAANGGLFEAFAREPRVYGFTLRKSFGE